MIEKIQSVRGMHVYLPQDLVIWKYVESTLEMILNNYGYDEIRFPIVERTELFRRSIGEITDVIEKEMYSFDDRNGDNLTLRPEGTSGCVRAGIEHGLFYHQEQKLWYFGPMFRRERPQKGRYRQFHQFSVEAFGQVGPDIDIEMLLINVRCWKKLGIFQYLSLELNSIGSVISRVNYRKVLIEFLKKHVDSLDKNDIRRLYYNPLRVLDTKNEKTRNVLKFAPSLIDYLDEDSYIHFSKLCDFLDALEISYIVNPYLVRGLDYYNRTVFEWVTDCLGVKKTICAGGRYDGLIKQLGGEDTPAIGFSIGLERTVLLMQAVNSKIAENNLIYIDVYMIGVGCNVQKFVIELSEYIRSVLPKLRMIVGYSNNGNVKKKLSAAYKKNAKVVLIIEEKNVFLKNVQFKNLCSGKQENIKYDEVINKLKCILSL